MFGFLKRKRPTYPHAAGFQATDTSRDAAEAANLTISQRQALVLAALRSHGPQTIIQVCNRIDLMFHQIQPRFSELRALGLIEDSGARGPSRDPSKSAIVWRIVATPQN